MLLLIHAGIKVNPSLWKGPQQMMMLEMHECRMIMNITCEIFAHINGLVQESRNSIANVLE